MGGAANAPAVYSVMTFPLIKPAGWIDNVDPILSGEITQVDANLARAIDGANGGTYAPASPLVIGGVNGLQITNCVNHNVRGPYQLSGPRASIHYRVDRTTIDPSLGTLFTIDTSADIYISTSPLILGDISVTLNTNAIGYEAAADGATIIVRKHAVLVGPQTDAFKMYFVLSPGNAGYLPAITLLALPQANPYIDVEFLFVGSLGKWVVNKAHPQVVMI